MHSRPYRRRLLLPASAALLIVIQATGVAVGIVGKPAVVPAPTPVAASPASVATDRPAVTRPRVRSDRMTAHVAIPTAPFRDIVDPTLLRVTTPTAQTAGAQAQTTAKAPPKASPSAGGSSGTVYRGRNHVWIPSLGLNRSVVFFPCSRSTYPGNEVYSWGCAGRNNVYLFGHAATVMRPLHDAYYSKRLKVGMKVVYADGNGRIRTYKVSFWRVVSPVDAGWAFAAQSRPSLTLQTCVGSRSQWRLVVRLVQSG